MKQGKEGNSNFCVTIPCEYTNLFVQGEIAFVIQPASRLFGLSCRLEGKTIAWHDEIEAASFLTDIVHVANLLRFSPSIIEQRFNFSLWDTFSKENERYNAYVMLGTDTGFGAFNASGRRRLRSQPTSVRLQFFPFVAGQSDDPFEPWHFSVSILLEDAERAGLELLAIADQLIEEHDVHGIWWRKFGREVEPKIVEESEGKYPLFEPPPEEEE